MEQCSIGFKSYLNIFKYQMLGKRHEVANMVEGGDPRIFLFSCTSLVQWIIESA